MTEADATKWKQTYVYGLPHERLSVTYLPANDHDNGWEPSPGVGGAEPGVPPKTLWYLTDALGSTLSLLEKDGRKSVSYHYDEFGIPLDDKKFDVNWPGPDNLFGYTGLGYDYYSELTYARARYYQPEIGRFISEDPYKGDLWNPQSQNRFVYVENNPVLYIDPSGNMKLNQIDDLLLGVKDTLWGTLKDTLDWKTYKGFYDLGMALLNRDIKIEDLLSAIGSSAKQKVEYFQKNTKHVFASNPTDKEVRRYGQELGDILTMVGGSAAAVKLIKKVNKKLGELLEEAAKRKKNNFGKINVSKIPNMSKKDILSGIPSNWSYTDKNGFVHIRDANGNIRIRIDPPDKKTNYHHVHLYDEKGNSLDKNLNIVDYKSKDAHIPYKHK